jgi:hypothetical protein
MVMANRQPEGVESLELAPRMEAVSAVGVNGAVALGIQHVLAPARMINERHAILHAGDPIRAVDDEN